MSAGRAFLFGLCLTLPVAAYGGQRDVDARPPTTSAQPGILVLSVEDPMRPWMQQIGDGFRETALKSPDQPILYFESLDAVRFKDPHFAEELRRWLRFKYQNVSVNLVVTVGEHALYFLARAGGEPWPRAAVLYVEVGEPTFDTRSELPQATGILFEDHFPAALRVIKEILPGSERVALVFGASDVEASRFTGFAGKVRRTNLGLEPEMLSGLPMPDLVTRAASMPKSSVLFLLSPAVDYSGRILTPAGPCQSLAPAAAGPTFSLDRHDLGCGVVGGLLRDWKVIGQILGEQALAHLNGAGEGIVVQIPAGQFTSLAFDARELERWRIPEGRLPANSTILFRQPNLWRDYRDQVIAALAVVFLQALLIAGLVLEHRRRRRAEVESRRHLVTMAHLDRRAAMGELTASLAHELSQPLTAILRNAEAAKMVLASGPERLEEVQAIVEDIRRDDRRASAVIRRLRALLEKHELEMELVNINDVAQESVAVTSSDAAVRQVQVDLELNTTPCLVTGDKIHLQQALLNLVLNGLDAVMPMPPEERRLVVRTMYDAEAVDVSVADSGPGIPPDIAPHIFKPFFSTKPPGVGMGMGLSIARSIIEAHGGSISAANGADRGATVRFRLPLQRGDTA
jgi:signal transduction histidine kinase